MPGDLLVSLLTKTRHRAVLRAGLATGHADPGTTVAASARRARRHPRPKPAQLIATRAESGRTRARLAVEATDRRAADGAGHRRARNDTCGLEHLGAPERRSAPAPPANRLRLLPAADRHLLDIDAWVHRRLTAAAEHPHERPLRRFALWHQLPRMRADTAVRPLRATAKQYVTRQFTQAEALLTWLHERGVGPAATAQANVDSWYSTHRIHQRKAVRGFLLGPPSTDTYRTTSKLESLSQAETVDQPKRLDVHRDHPVHNPEIAVDRCATGRPGIGPSDIQRRHRFGR